MPRWVLLAALLLAAGCGSSSPASRPAHHAKPTCSQLLKTARHELGDTGAEIRHHCHQ